MCAIYTKRGDSGLTDLANGERVAKNEIRLDVCGTLDELTSFLGLVRAENISESTETLILGIQEKLLLIGSEVSLSSAESKILDKDLAGLEREIDLTESILPPLKTFIIPGGVRSATCLHVARTVCRRLERLFAAMQSPQAIPIHLAYINRLSDLLFVLARIEQQKSQN